MTDEQRAKRIHHHMYETCEGIAEHAERIVRLEEENEKLRKYAKITADNLYGSGCDCCPYKDDHEACDLGIMPNGECRPYRELRELGIEGDE